MKEKWISQTYGQLNINEIPDKMLIFYNTNKVYGEPLEITIGTDSQTHGDFTKVVSVISIICKGHGGIFFHFSEYISNPTSVRAKLEYETNRSLEITSKLIETLEQNKFQEMYMSCPVSIHIDAGNAPHGKTKDLIQSLVGWVHAMGYECEVKPNAWTASTIADRISK